VNERAERCQTTIENESAMIDVQVRCEKEVTRMQQEILTLEQTTTTFNNDSEVLRQEIHHLSGRNARLQEELLESTHDKEMNDLKRQVQELNRVVQEQHEHQETLHTKLNAAEDMKVWLTKEWEKTEQEAVRLKQKLTRSSKEKVKADGSVKDMHELLVFLSEQLRVHEYDRGLRLAVKEEWSRLLMGSAVMNKWFVCEREVGMVKSWVLRRQHR
jgi:predicted  nucleic acid-binding Zn-ribbon protein